MNDTVRGRAIEGLLLMLGLILGGWILGCQIKATRLADRYVTVKGLVERNVKSDLAIWPIPFKESGANLQSVLAQSEKDKSAVLDFLKAQGFPAEEISVGNLGVTDRLSEAYDTTAKPESRFIVSQTITLTTKSVDRAVQTGAKAADLVRAGVILSYSGTQSGVSYYFTGLNSLKPDMITEATRNARAAAARFAQDSGSEVGPIRSASQGVFSISAASEVGTGDGGDAGASADASVMKKVRVVTTVDYYLIK